MNTLICPGCDAPVGLPDIIDLYDTTTLWVGCDCCGKAATVTVTVEARAVAQQPGRMLSFG